MDTREAITEFLFVRHEAAPVDLCVVLGSMHPTTVDPAIELWRKGWTPRILITGHGPNEDQEKEADLFLNYALEQGIPRDALWVEREARHTRDNFVLSAEIVEREVGWDGIKRVAIVGKPFHMRRALMTVQRFWPEGITYLMLPSSDPRDLKPEDWWQSERGRKRVIDEIRRIGEYAAKGDLGGY